MNNRGLRARADEEKNLREIYSHISSDIRLYASYIEARLQEQNVEAKRAPNQVRELMIASEKIRSKVEDSFPEEAAYFGPIVHTGKKFVDLTEDTYIVAKDFIPQAIGKYLGPAIITGFGLAVTYVEMQEAWQLYGEAKKADSTDPLKATNENVALLILGIGLLDIGCSAAYAAPIVAEVSHGAIAAEAVAAAHFMPIGISFLFLALYSVSLYRQNKVYEQAQKKESSLREDLIGYFTQNTSAINQIRTKIAEKAVLAPDEIEIMKVYHEKQAHYEQARVVCGLEKAKTDAAKLEVLGSLLVCIGTVASLGSFGILPTLIIVLGVAVALLGKMQERKAHQKAVNEEYELAKGGADLVKPEVAYLPFHHLPHLKKWIGEIKEAKYLTLNNLIKALECYKKIGGLENAVPKIAEQKGRVRLFDQVKEAEKESRTKHLDDLLSSLKSKTSMPDSVHEVDIPSDKIVREILSSFKCKIVKGKKKEDSFGEVIKPSTR